MSEALVKKVAEYRKSITDYRQLKLVQTGEALTGWTLEKLAELELRIEALEPPKENEDGAG